MNPENPFGLGGFSEAGICTREPEAWLNLLTGIGGWNEVWRGETPASIKRLWGLEPSVTVEERLLSSKRGQPGQIRLFSVHGVAQEAIRKNTKTWDSGGIFDLDIRVGSLQSFVAPLEKLGWKSICPVVDWRFEQFQVREWLSRGLDEVVLALIERVAPPLENYGELEGFSEVFNSSQIVADMGAALAFYEAFGLKKTVDHSGPLAGRGGEVLGLDPEQAPITPVRLVILAVAGQEGGSLELVSFEEAEEQFHGENLSAQARPFNLGMNLLRFPVQDLHGLIEHLGDRGIHPEAGGMVKAPVFPEAETNLVAFRSPDGVWMEFYNSGP